MDKGLVDGGPSDAASGLEISKSPAGVRERVEGGLEPVGGPLTRTLAARRTGPLAVSSFLVVVLTAPGRTGLVGWGDQGTPASSSFSQGLSPLSKGQEHLLCPTGVVGLLMTDLEGHQGP